MKKVFSLLLAAVMLFALVVPTLAAYTVSDDDYTVYVTPSGKKYHRQTCPTLANSKTVIAMSRSEAIASGRTACKDCKPDSGNTTPTPTPPPAPVVTPDPTPVIRTNPVAGFVDVDSSDWFANAVKYAKDAGLMNGVGDNRFDPHGNVTRAMVVTVLYRVIEQPDVSGKVNPFVDVTAGEWYTNAIVWAADAGVTTGTDATHFSPFQPITREQMATMIMRMLLTFADENSRKQLEQIEKLDPTGAIRRQMLAETFTDAASVSDYARTYVLLCKQGGIMNGDSAGTFRPQATLSRAECAQTFLNIYERFGSLAAQ